MNPPPPPSFSFKVDPQREKLIKQFGTFQGDQLEELEKKIQRSEDINAAYMNESDGLGITEEKEIDKSQHYQCHRCERYIPHYLEQTHLNSHSSKVLDWMYLGAENNAENLIELTVRTNISYILNCAQECANFYPNQFTYLHLPLNDLLDSEIETHFDECYDFIDKCRQENKNILIHCAQGKSRSVTILLMYLMRNYKMTLKEAFELTINARSIIRPNPGFVQKILNFEFQLFGKNTMEAKELNQIVIP